MEWCAALAKCMGITVHAAEPAVMRTDEDCYTSIWTCTWWNTIVKLYMIKHNYINPTKTATGLNQLMIYKRQGRSVSVHLGCSCSWAAELDYYTSIWNCTWWNTIVELYMIKHNYINKKKHSYTMVLTLASGFPAMPLVALAPRIITYPLHQSNNNNQSVFVIQVFVERCAHIDLDRRRTYDQTRAAQSAMSTLCYGSTTVSFEEIAFFAAVVKLHCFCARLSGT